jgi:ribokinase
VSVIVFGSINMDLVTRTPRLPGAGETIIGSEFYTTPGGKGANQAVAVAQLGVETHLVGRVGNDAFGQQLLAELRQAGVRTEQIQVEESMHSGVAVITVGDRGENQIVGVFGANGKMDSADIERLKPLLPSAKALLLQLEIPITTVKAAAQAAQAASVPVILDPAPVPRDSIADLYPLVDILVPNEVEASQLTGLSVTSPETAAAAAGTLQQQGAKTVIVKLGAQGAFCATLEEGFFVPAFAVEAIDTVAAGDAFAGGLVAGLVAGLPLKQAVRWGCAAGALATTKVGAQSAMSDRATFDRFLTQHQSQT